MEESMGGIEERSAVRNACEISNNYPTVLALCDNLPVSCFLKFRKWIREKS